MILAVIIAFAAGFLIGTITEDVVEEKETYRDGIDPDELISWIENYQYNYEYVAPPTTGEIIAYIRKMKEAGRGNVEE